MKIAVVTGGNRGIGFEVCRQLAKLGIKVVLTSRDVEKGKKAAISLQDEGLPVEFFKLEVSNYQEDIALHDYLKQKYGKLDILVNNAGIMPEKVKENQGIDEDIFHLDYQEIEQTIHINSVAPLMLSHTLLPLMIVNQYGRIVNVSSTLGQMSSMGAGYIGYRISKTALNAITKILAAEVRQHNILVNSVCPGWVKTEMGGSHAPLTVQQGADTIIWLATAPDRSATGEFFKDRKRIDW
jgi:NAD(P)-dependent dehydrogenase (short-subunit alcohol dehydrogenase family)